MRTTIAIAPSILSADFACLADAIRTVEEAGADYIHVDVMDGHFVPNLTIGPPVVRALKRVATVPLDVHLMIEDPDSSVEWYLDAGADIVTVHVEAATHLHRIAQTVRARGAKMGVSLNPATPVATLEAALPHVDLVLVMSVNPGFGGQSYIQGSEVRVAELKRLCEKLDVSPLVEVDGGIDATTAPLVTKWGADILVAGNAIFGTDDPARALKDLRRSALSSIV